MVKILILINSLFLTQITFAQQKEFVQFNKERDKISRAGLKVLIAYSAANIIYSTIASTNKITESNKYFHQMNVIWNGVTLGLIGIGLVTSKQEGPSTFASSIKKQANIEQLFLFNAGLDLAYFAGGAYLRERGFNSTINASRLQGYGSSIMLQGAVLFFFDGIMYGIHKFHGKALNNMAENIQLTTANGIGIALQF